MRLLKILLIVALLSIIVGVESCPEGGLGPSGPSGPGSSAGSNKGLEVSLTSGLGYLGQGSIIDGDSTFKIKVRIENYDKSARQGQICVRDDKDNAAYGGVSQECIGFSVKEAEYSGEQFISQSYTEVYFPSLGEYSYHDIPIAEWPSKLFITYTYLQDSAAQGLVNSPDPEQETLSLNKISGPVSLSIEKTIGKQYDQYKVNLGITFNKQTVKDVTIYSRDMTKENAIDYSIKLGKDIFMDCPQGTLDFGTSSTKFIKCSALLPLQQLSNPLLIYLYYNVKTVKTYDFKIKKAA